METCIHYVTSYLRHTSSLPMTSETRRGGFTRKKSVGHADIKKTEENMYESEIFPEKSERQEEGSPLRQYYATIRNHALLSAEEEKSLSHQYHQTKDQQALQRLISCNLRLVVKIA